MKISTKLVSFFLISALLPIIVIGFISFDLAQTSLENEIFTTVNEQADLQVNIIENNFLERKADALVISNDNIFKQEIPILNQFYHDTDNKLFVESTQRLDERIDTIVDAYGYSTIGIINPEGDIIYAAGKASSYVGLSLIDYAANPLAVHYNNAGISNIAHQTDKVPINTMNKVTKRTVRIVGVPMDLGASRRGTDMGPSALRIAGLGAELRRMGYKVAREEDI